MCAFSGADSAPECVFPGVVFLVVLLFVLFLVLCCAPDCAFASAFLLYRLVFAGAFL